MSLEYLMPACQKYQALDTLLISGNLCIYPATNISFVLHKRAVREMQSFSQCQKMKRKCQTREVASSNLWILDTFEVSHPTKCQMQNS